MLQVRLRSVIVPHNATFQRKLRDTLFWSAVINGVIALPVVIVMLLLGSSERELSQFRTDKRLRWLGWMATTVMAVAVVAMVATI